jgi:quercetin dioxygenase-like cupin family protein
VEILNVDDKEEKKIESFPYKGKNYEVKGVGIRWLSQAGPPDSPEYGLRFFTVAPGGEIPIHNHFYVQTMYILTGSLTVYAHDNESNAPISERVVSPNDLVFVPSLEPHSMKNFSDSEVATFLCCIANVYDEDME